jgi:hypothetical protein
MAAARIVAFSISSQNCILAIELAARVPMRVATPESKAIGNELVRKGVAGIGFTWTGPTLCFTGCDKSF